MTTCEEPADWFARAARWPGAIMLGGALALLVGTVGMSDLPLDGHEVLVARTAQEMHDRGEQPSNHPRERESQGNPEYPRQRGETERTDRRRIETSAGILPWDGPRCGRPRHPDSPTR